MASVCATFDSSTTTTPGVAAPSPIHWPSWTAPDTSYLSLSCSPLGPRAVWTSRVSTHRTLSSPFSSASVLPSLAFFPPSAADPPDFLNHFHALKSTARAPSLCALVDSFLVVSTPGGDHLHVAPPSPRPILRLLPLLSGLLLELAPLPPESSEYYFLSRPLDPMVRLSFPERGHSVVYASLDLPLLVSRSRSRSTLVVWTARERLRPADPHPPFSGAASCAGNDDDLIAAFVRGAAETASTEAGLDGGVEPLLAEQPVRELALRKVYEAPLDEGDDVSAFVAHDLRGKLVLCVCGGGELTGLAFEVRGMEVVEVMRSFRIPDVDSAVAVLAVRRRQRCLDILVRRASGRMALFMGRNKLCTVELEDLTRWSSEVGEAHLRAEENLVVSDAVADQFTLVDSGGRGVRYSLRGAAFASPMVNACLGAVSVAFESAGIMRRMATLWHDVLTARMRGVTEGGGEEERGEWAVFSRVLLQAGKRDGTDCMETDYEAREENSSDKDLGNEAWNTLLSSEYHALRRKWRARGPAPYSLGPALQEKSKVGERTGLDGETLRHALDALHLVYEDQKLSPLGPGAMRQLAYLNIRLAKAIGAGGYVDHYRRDFGNLGLFEDGETSSSIGNEKEIVPSIMDHLRNLVCFGGENYSRYPVLELAGPLETQCTPLTACWRTKSPVDLTSKILRYFEYLYGENLIRLSFSKRAQALLLAMVEDRFTRLELEALPFGIALPIQDALLSCRERPERTWPYGAFALIGREDMFNFTDLDTAYIGIEEPEKEIIDESRAVLRIQAAASSMMQATEAGFASTGKNVASMERDHTKMGVDEANADGCDMYGHLFRLRFSSDRRAEEVRRMLRSTDPIVMTAPKNPNSDPNVEFDIYSEQKYKLDILLRKRYAAPVGRGAFTLRTCTPSDPTKPLSVPEICTSGTLFAQKGSRVTLLPKELTGVQWGEFHNGVAAGLRILAADGDRDSDSGQILTRSWIVNHRPTDNSGSASHAGMLLAFGLGGYLPALRTTDYYEYLVPRHDLTSIGLMLGLATGNIGSRHEKITKMFCVHIRYFNGPGFAVPDFHVSADVQTAAILGLGLLHLGSCEHLIMDGLFSELSYRPRPGDHVDNREAHALAAGLSIGLVCLGNGSAAFDASDSRLIDRLVLYANGGPNDDAKATQRSLHSISGKTNVATGQDRSGHNLADSEASRVKENDFVNTDIVSPGALLALALIYLKTNNKRIAERIIIPDTLYSLDRARPDQVFLRALTRTLIMWDQIDGSKEWIIETLPSLLRPAVSSESSDAYDLLGRVKIGTSYKEHDVDIDGILHARAFATAAACTAIALKYAGTSDPDVAAVLLQECESFEKAFVQQQKRDESSMWVYMTCLSSAALALSVVSAGSGDLCILRLLRRIRKRGGKTDQGRRYGYHLAMHMAIGFLFLGGGCQTFGSSNIAIVGLLCAIYPRFPEDVADNQFHLQAMRHLYVLATEPRCIETRDVDTGIPCCVNVKIFLKNGTILQRKAPCIVPDANTVKGVSVVSERYWPTTAIINPSVPGKGWYSSTKFQVLFVKRKTGHLPYSADPKGSKGINARSLHQPPLGSEDESSYFSQVDHLVRAFSADPDVLSFVKYFCSPASQKCNREQSSRAIEKARRHVEILYECLSEDKPEAVRMYMNTERALESIKTGLADPSSVGSLMIAGGYIQAGRMPPVSLLRATYLSKLMYSVESLVNYSETRRAILQYVWTGGRMWPNSLSMGGIRKNLASDTRVLLRLSCIPSPGLLGNLVSILERLPSDEGSSEKKWFHFSQVHTGSTHSLAIERIISATELESVDRMTANRW